MKEKYVVVINVVILQIVPMVNIVFPIRALLDAATLQIVPLIRCVSTINAKL
jgi:hypothetical protein